MIMPIMALHIHMHLVHSWKFWHVDFYLMTSIISVSFIFVHTADCGVPLVNKNVTLNYSSTLGGSVLVLTCENEMSNMNTTDEQVLTVTCHSNGNWIPDPADFTCSSFTTILPGIIHSVHMGIVGLCFVKTKPNFFSLHGYTNDDVMIFRYTLLIDVSTISIIYFAQCRNVITDTSSTDWNC